MLKRHPTGQLRIHQYKLTAQMEFSNVDFMFPPFSDCFIEGFRGHPSIALTLTCVREASAAPAASFKRPCV